jgi:hypothetical protein
MLKKFKLQVVVQMVLALLFFIGSANALNISFQAFDLVDTTAGEDLWRYDYTLSDHSFAADTGFQIFFDYTLFANLDFSPPSPNTDWDVLTEVIDPVNNFDGVYDAYALFDNASLADVFSVEFTWLGSGSPGAQAFALYDGITWAVIDSGTSVESSQVAPVPEPGTFILLGTGLLGLARLSRKK